MRRLVTASFAAVALLAALSSAPAQQQTGAAPQPGSRLISGLVVPAIGVGNDYPVPALLQFTAAAGVTRLVLDFDCIGDTGPGCDARALKALAEGLQGKQISLCAMYRPRFSADPTVPTQVTADGRPASSTGFEICYSKPEARQWGSAWAARILKTLPSCDEIIVVPGDGCKCNDCAAADQQPPRPGLAAFLRECREALRASGSTVRLGLVGSANPTYWQRLGEIADRAHPLYPLLEKYPTAAVTSTLSALHAALQDRLGFALYQLSSSPYANVSALHQRELLQTARALGLEAALWGLDTGFLSDLYDPQEVAAASGLDWQTVAPALDRMFAESDIDDGVPLLTVSPDRPDLETVKGSYAVVTTVVKTDPYYAVAQQLAEYHRVPVVQLSPRSWVGFYRGLQTLRAEQIAIVAPPEHIIPDLVQVVFLAAVTMDHDVDMDFTYGFITGDTPDDAAAMVQRTFEAHQAPPRPGRALCVGHVFGGAEHCYQTMETRAAFLRDRGVPALPLRCDDADPPDLRRQRAAAFEGASLIAFCGHGSGTESCGVIGRDLLTSRLDHAVVFDGSCFSGAVSEMWLPDLKTQRLRRVELPPQSSIALCMIHAGAIGRFGSVCSNSFGLVLEACRGIDTGLSLGEAYRYCQNFSLRRARLREITIYPYREGEISPQQCGGFAHKQSANIAAVVLYGDPSYVPLPGGLPRVEPLNLAATAGTPVAPLPPATTLPAVAPAPGTAPATAPTPAATPATGPEPLTLAPGTCEYVMRGQNGLSVMIIQYLADRSFTAPSHCVSDNRGVRTLLRFDLRGVSLPPEVKLKRVFLKLCTTKVTGPENPGERPLAVCAVTSAWDKTVTWATAPQFADTPLATLIYDQKAPTAAFEVTDQVKAWLADPTKNYGLLVKFMAENQTPPVTWYFAGVTSASDAIRPRLVFECE